MVFFAFFSKKRATFHRKIKENAIFFEKRAIPGRKIALFSKKEAIFDAYGTLMVPPESQKSTISFKDSDFVRENSDLGSEIASFSNKIACFGAYGTLMVPNEVSFGQFWYHKPLMVPLWYLPLGVDSWHSCTKMFRKATIFMKKTCKKLRILRRFNAFC